MWTDDQNHAMTALFAQAEAGGFDVTPLQALGGFLVALIVTIYAAQKFIFEKYLPTKQANDQVERTAEREHEQNLVSKLTDQSAELQRQLFEVVTTRLQGIEQNTHTAVSESSKLVGQIEALNAAVRTMQLELRELRGQVGGAAVVAPAEPKPRPRANPRPKPKAKAEAEETKEPDNG